VPGAASRQTFSPKSKRPFELNFSGTCGAPLERKKMIDPLEAPLIPWKLCVQKAIFFFLFSPSAIRKEKEEEEEEERWPAPVS
jgi:hypothetical protein